MGKSELRQRQENWLQIQSKLKNRNVDNVNINLKVSYLILILIVNYPKSSWVHAFKVAFTIIFTYLITYLRYLASNFHQFVTCDISHLLEIQKLLNRRDRYSIYVVWYNVLNLVLFCEENINIVNYVKIFVKKIVDHPREMAS